VIPDKSSIIKVLNRVKCHESQQRYCKQNDIDAIWQLCLNSGYVTNIQSSQIVSAREITELVSGSVRVVETVLTPVEKTNEYGIVSIENYGRTESVDRPAKGYCIGSEYIRRG